MTAGPQIPEARQWLVKMLGVTICVLHGHTPTQEGLPIRFDFRTSAMQRLASSTLHGCDSFGTEGLLSSGGKICYEAQRCGGLRRLSVNAKEAD